MFRKCIH